MFSALCFKTYRKNKNDKRNSKRATIEKGLIKESEKSKEYIPNWA